MNNDRLQKLRFSLPTHLARNVVWNIENIIYEKSHFSAVLKIMLEALMTIHDFKVPTQIFYFGQQKCNERKIRFGPKNRPRETYEAFTSWKDRGERSKNVEKKKWWWSNKKFVGKKSGHFLKEFQSTHVQYTVTKVTTERYFKKKNIFIEPRDISWNSQGFISVIGFSEVGFSIVHI